MNDQAMLNHLASPLTTIEREFPGCGLLLCGDFNCLNIKRITTQFRLKQLVNKPTRGKWILDLVLTNLPLLYDKNSVQTLPPFGLSDHNVVILRPKTRPVREGSSRKQILRRGTRASRKLELGRYFCGIDWSLVECTQSCAAKIQLFTDVVKTGLDTIMPVKKSKIHTRDAPWVSPQFKELVKLRQKAFNDGDVNLFHYYQNAVNRERKTLQGRYYASKVSQLKYSKPSQWWNSVRRITQMTPVSGSDTIISSLQVEGTDGLSEQNIANMINAAFVEPLESFQRLESVPTPEEGSTPLIIPESAILSALEKLNPRKAAGPDEIPNWLLKAYADIFAYPVSMIINCSFAENRLPLAWKMADVVPIPKVKPVEDISKHLRPISLTLALSKVAEDFVVGLYVGPAVMEVIDPNQYGGIPKSSTLHALTSMVHNWSKTTDGNGAAVRVCPLRVSGFHSWKYVDDITVAEIVP